ncbi:SMP-30/gluconolactonase/LRE family protein [Cupriavidus basilensis]
MAFNNKKTALFVANTANDIVVKIPLTGSTLEPGTPEVFVNRIGGGPDGVKIDEHDNLWIACNQSNEILVLEPTQGRVIAKLGDFGGHRSQGGTHRLLSGQTASSSMATTFLSPTSRSISRRPFRNSVTSLAWRISWASNLRTIDGPWAQRVKIHTISKIKKRIPELDGGPQ